MACVCYACALPLKDPVPPRVNFNQRLTATQSPENQGSRNNKSLQAGSVLPSGAYLQRLHHSDGSSSQGEFNISDLNGWDKMID
jgi:hypothetical protein